MCKTLFWRCLVAIVTIAAQLAFAVLPANASDTTDIVCWATPIYTAGINGFTITYVNDRQLDFSWFYGEDAVKIMIRGKYGDYPADIPDENTAPSDGYLVYYGNSTTCSDTSMDFDANPGPIYYRAWGQRADGTWIMSTTTGKEESRVMTLLGFIFLAVALTIATFAVRSGRWILAFASTGAWILLGVYNYTLYEIPWDINYSLFWLSMGMAVVTALSPGFLRDKKEKGIDPLDELDDDERAMLEDSRAMEADQQRLNRLMGRESQYKRYARSKPTLFAKTGIIRRTGKIE